jgi:glycosyltransferase involved in cell wall biosynthesis
MYRELCEIIIGRRKFDQSVLVANSEWTRNIVQETYRQPVKVVYPPVNVSDFNFAVSGRENGFVTIGEIHQRKGQDMMIDIIDQLRSIGIDTHLHVVGGIGNQSYFETVQKKSEKRSYIHLEGFLDRTELIDLIERHKYGLHGHPREHFGITVAELVAGGSIPFVPNDGGQVEIVNRRTELQYGSVQQAVDKISSVMTNAQLQQDIKSDLNRSISEYSSEKFEKRIKHLVNNLIDTYVE